MKSKFFFVGLVVVALVVSSLFTIEKNKNRPEFKKQLTMSRLLSDPIQALQKQLGYRLALRQNRAIASFNDFADGDTYENPGDCSCTGLDDVDSELKDWNNCFACNYVTTLKIYQDFTENTATAFTERVSSTFDPYTTDFDINDYADESFTPENVPPIATVGDSRISAYEREIIIYGERDSSGVNLPIDEDTSGVCLALFWSEKTSGNPSVPVTDSETSTEVIVEFDESTGEIQNSDDLPSDVDVESELAEVVAAIEAGTNTSALVQDAVKGLFIMDPSRCGDTTSESHGMVMKFDLRYTDADVQNAEFIDQSWASTSTDFDNNSADGADSTYYYTLSIDSSGSDPVTSFNMMRLFSSGSSHTAVKGVDDVRMMTSAIDYNAAWNSTATDSSSIFTGTIYCQDDTVTTGPDDDTSECTSASWYGDGFADFVVSVSDIADKDYPGYTGAGLTTATTGWTPDFTTSSGSLVEILPDK